MSPRHPANTLNELSGEEWLYFTKSVWGTAYPSELGHAARKQHGANKPPRLMARLIEFFTTGGELVLDPFAGVGGTLLGAAIARTARRRPSDSRSSRAGWRSSTRSSPSSRRSATARDRCSPTSARPIPAASDRSTRPGIEMRLGDSLLLLPELQAESVDFVATDPPYNIQLPITMSGGKLAEAHSNRRTDYAMVTDHDGDLANSADYATFLDRMEELMVQLLRVLEPDRYAAVIVRDAYQDGQYIFTGSDLAARAGRAGFTVKGDVIWYQAGTRLRPYGYPRSYVPNISHQHVLILRRESRRKASRPKAR